ncbi:hypothetical protein [Metabacillus sp. Hm71]|uniref:hypothetical protein n=1 Tax=Metabacillus sp. Hm71 TaxID=3450743 RepID=UPI003F43C22B
MENFKEEYLSHKAKNLTDEEISELMFMSTTTLKVYKKKNGLKNRKPCKNYLGITEEHFKSAAEIGLNRKLVLDRVRVLGWSISKAISTPKLPPNKRKMKGVST